METAYRAPEREPDATLTVDVVRFDALDAVDFGRWRAWQLADPRFASPYFHPAFARIAGRISPNSGVAVFSRAGRAVGYFPFQRRGGAVQPIAAPMNDYHGVVTVPGEVVSLQDVARLMAAPRLSVGAWVGQATGGFERTSLMTEAPEGGFDAWYAERRQAFGKYFKDKERARRSLEAEHGSVRVEFGVRDPVLLDRLIELKREQFRRTRRHDVFACGWTTALLLELMLKPQDGLGASICVLWAGERIAALEYSLHADDQYHFWFPAYEPDLARCSPGIILSLETMRTGMGRGYRLFDYGFGGEAYKTYFVNRSASVREAVILKAGLGAALSGAAVSLLNGVGTGRGDRLRTSVRRRWAAIEACETTRFNRFKGAASAARAAVGKLARATAPA